MNKATLESVIKKYYLSGLVETSIWKVLDDKKLLKIGACTPNFVLSIVVDVANFTELSANEFAVSDTSKLLKMTGVLDDDVKFALNKDNNGKITSVLMTSTGVEMQYVTADITVLRANKAVQTWNKPDPEYEVEIIIDKDFIDTYTRSKSALSDSEYVVFQMNADNKLEMVFGYVQGGNKSLNTSKIKYQPKTNAGKDKLPMSLGYNADYLKEILSANKDAENAILQLSSATLAHMKCSQGDVTINYHMRGIVIK